MVTSRLADSTGIVFSALLFAAAFTVAFAIPAGTASPGKGRQIVADHGWGWRVAPVPVPPDGPVVPGTPVVRTQDHGWG